VILRLPETVERLYIDFDSYFASVEQQLQPKLRGRPVGVIPLDTQSTCIIAASREAKAYGIRTGTSVREAIAICPDIALPVARPDEYVRQHHAILKELDRHLPVKKVWSIDEMEFELIGRERREFMAIADRMKRGLADAVGPYVTGSIGIASNQFLAKIGAEMEKPDGLVVFHPETLPGRLLELGLKDLPGIASGMHKRLLAAGISSVEALWSISPVHARAIWGSVEGERMWAQLHGYSVSRSETTRRMFGHGRVLERSWRTPEKAYGCARLLLTMATRRMRKQGYAAKGVGLNLRFEKHLHWSANQKVNAATDDHTFLKALGLLFQAAIAQNPQTRVYAVNVMVFDLVAANGRMNDLFSEEEDTRMSARWENISAVMDTLTQRHGKSIVSIGPLMKPPGDYLGAKIAFGRIPDMDDF
jgi:DNA polymerase IV